MRNFVGANVKNGTVSSCKDVLLKNMNYENGKNEEKMD